MHRSYTGEPGISTRKYYLHATRDKRYTDQPTAIHTCAHSDDINVLSFNTSKPQLLLSGAADGLLSITDVLETDEDEAVIHVGNWGCSVAKAGWMHMHEGGKIGSLKSAIWSTSDMETMAVWSEEVCRVTAASRVVANMYNDSSTYFMTTETYEIRVYRPGRRTISSAPNGRAQTPPVHGKRLG